MPNITRELVRELNCEARLEHLIGIEGITDPSILASRLNETPELKVILNGREFFPADITKYMEGRVKAQDRIQAQALSSSPEIKAINQQLSALVQGLVHRGEQAMHVCDLVNQDFFTQRMHYQAYQTGLAELRRKLADNVITEDEFKDAKKRLGYAEYPHDMVGSIEKATKSIVTLINTVKSDEKVQQIVKAGRLTVNQGMSSDQLIEELCVLGEALGLSRGEVVAKYAEAKAKRKPIDA